MSTSAMSTSTIPVSNRLQALSRNATIVSSVIALHVLVLWALQTGLLRRVAEAVVPAEILVEIMSPPAAPAAPKPVPPVQAKPQPQTVMPKSAHTSPAPATTPQAASTPLALPTSTTATDPGAAAPTAVAAAPAAASTGSTANAAPAPSKLELPSSDADYLNNPRPPYPPMSKRLHEQGKVVVRAWIGTDGQASQASILNSSGFDRLDQAALATVLKWRYAPGKRSGVAEAMWFNVPINWVLQ
jgi:protein TonB